MLRSSIVRMFERDCPEVDELIARLPRGRYIDVLAVASDLFDREYATDEQRERDAADLREAWGA